MSRQAQLFTLLALVAAFTTPAPARDGTRPIDAPASIAGVDAMLQGAVARKEISGAVTLVAHDGRVVHHSAVGLADIEERRAMTRDSLFAIASMTKPITATAVMILQDEGRLTVDDPASRYLPAFANVRIDGGAPKRAITLRDLLTHTSGVSGRPRGPEAEGLSLAEVVDHIASSPLQFEPGSTWSYGDGLTVCGRIVEVVSGKPFEVFLKERIFDPLGMKDTAFQPTKPQRSRQARIYQPTEDKSSIEPVTVAWADPDRKRFPNPSGGLFSTSHDMLRFYQAILNGGELEGRRIVSKDAVDAMRTIQTGALVTGFTPGNGWGLGWCVVREPQDVTASLSPGTFGHGGAFGTQGWIDPTRRTIFVLMIQRTRFGNSDGSSIRKEFQDIAVSSLRKATSNASR